MTHNNDRSLRLLATLALALLVVIGWVGLRLALTNLGLLLLYAVLAAALAAGGWWTFSATGRKRTWGIILSCVALIGLVITTLALARESLWQLLLLLLLAGAYTSAAASVARAYWTRERARTMTPANTFRKPVLIVNPKSGDGRAIKAGIPDKAEALGIKVTVTKKGQDIVALARSAAQDGADVLGVSGGDGTLGAVAAVAMEHGLPLVILPGGTRCHFARDIGLNPEQIVDSLDAFTGTKRIVDVGIINDRVFLNNASFGLYADIISRPEYRDNKMDVTRDVTQKLASSKHPDYPLGFTDNQGHKHHRAAQVLVGINRYETLKLGELGVRKRLNEGILHVIVLPALNDTTLKSLAGTVALPGRNISDPRSGLQEWTTQQFTITDPSGHVAAGIDGESVVFDSPAQIRILPGALRLLVPAAGPSSRPIKPFSIEAAKTLWSFISGKS